MRNVIIIVGLIILLGVAFYFTRNYISSNPGGFLGLGANSAKVVIKDQTFNLTLAKTPQEQQIGLSGRTSIPKNNGMLFTYEKEGYPTFWMRNMQFPLDIIFIRDNKIVTLYKNIKPPTSSENLELYRPDEPTDAVLEITGGLSDQYGFKEGDTATITL